MSWSEYTGKKVGIDVGYLQSLHYKVSGINGKANGRITKVETGENNTGDRVEKFIYIDLDNSREGVVVPANIGSAVLKLLEL